MTIIAFITTPPPILPPRGLPQAEFEFNQTAGTDDWPQMEQTAGRDTGRSGTRDGLLGPPRRGRILGQNRKRAQKLPFRPMRDRAGRGYGDSWLGAGPMRSVPPAGAPGSTMAETAMRASSPGKRGCKAV